MPGFMNYPSTTQGVACVHLGLRNTAGAQALARTAPRPSPALSTLLCPSGWSPPSASPSTKASGGLPKRRVYGAAAAWEAACWLKTNPCRSFRGVRRAAEPACGEGRQDAGGTERARAGGAAAGSRGAAGHGDRREGKARPRRARRGQGRGGAGIPPTRSGHLPQRGLPQPARPQARGRAAAPGALATRPAVAAVGWGRLAPEAGGWWPRRRRTVAGVGHSRLQLVMGTMGPGTSQQ